MSCSFSLISLFFPPLSMKWAGWSGPALINVGSPLFSAWWWQTIRCVCVWVHSLGGVAHWSARLRSLPQNTNKGLALSTHPISCCSSLKTSLFPISFLSFFDCSSRKICSSRAQTKIIVFPSHLSSFLSLPQMLQRDNVLFQVGLCVELGKCVRHH